MILLIVAEDKEMVGKMLAILKKGGGFHEVHTASGFERAETAAAAMEQIDVLISTTFTSDGKDGFTFRDRLRARFPKLRAAFLNAYDLGGYEEAIGADAVLGHPPGESELLAWAASVGISRSPGGLPPVPLSPAPVPRRGGVLDEDDVPVAGKVHAPRRVLGDYRLMRVIGRSGHTESHEAVQMSIDRRVCLVLLKPEFCALTEEVREFRGAVRAKAAVTHPHIVPVYEGHEEEGALFYTRELVEGQNIVGLVAAKKKLRARVLFNIIKTTCEALLYLDANGIYYHDPEPRYIFLGSDENIRIANIATLEPALTRTPAESIRALGAALRPLLNRNNQGNVLMVKLLDMMASEEIAIDSWEELLELMRGIDDKLGAAEIFYPPGRASLQSAAGGRRGLVLGVMAAIVAVLAVVFALPYFGKPKAKEFGRMIWISGGEFIYQQGETRNLPSFWIDEHEVSIAQYAGFLAALEEDSIPTRFDHPDQSIKAPAKIGHAPESWDAYYAAAVEGGRYQGQTINLNCPVMLVDWWDAWAYAKWQGHRLPSEMEWEKAARGVEGNVYPWGNILDFASFNSIDGKDGYIYWAPVDAFPKDRSPSGVIGMEGNLSEWTDTWVDHPEIPDTLVPMARGGSFATKLEPASNFELSSRTRIFEPGERKIFLGFRTVSDRDPEESG
jgi:formylglycine-generating enzyme required for sulfatase activity/CheY-like chemotaxis protein